MDDVPGHLFPAGTTMEQAALFAQGVARTLRGRRAFASRADQSLAGGGIGTPCVCLWLVEFDGEGEPIRAAFEPVE